VLACLLSRSCYFSLGNRDLWFTTVYRRASSPYSEAGYEAHACEQGNYPWRPSREVRPYASRLDDRGFPPSWFSLCTCVSSSELAGNEYCWQNTSESFTGGSVNMWIFTEGSTIRLPREFSRVVGQSTVSWNVCSVEFLPGYKYPLPLCNNALFPSLDTICLYTIARQHTSGD
jgi:hypothetical protein